MSDSDDESYIIEAERKAKQNYLTEEILECNYDPELFMMYCGTKKEANIDAWTFEELQECVHDFKMTYRRGQTLKDVQEAEAKKDLKKPAKNEISPEPESKPVAMPPPVEVIKETPIKKELAKQNLSNEPKKEEVKKEESPLVSSPKVPEKKNEVVEKPSQTPEPEASKAMNESKPLEKVTEGVPETTEEKKEEIVIVDQKFSIKCVKLEDNELSLAKNLEFEMSEPELVEGGFFSSKYYLYPIKIMPLQWSIKRRFSEFVWLREMLCLMLPAHYVPPISTQKSGSNDEIVQKRQKFVLKFVQAVSRHPNLLRTSVAEGFFKTADYSEFVAFQKSFKKKVKKPETVDQFLEPEGVAECNITYQGPRADKLLEYASTTESIENKLKKQAQQIIYDIKCMQLAFNALKELVQQLEDAQGMLPYTDGLKKIYASLVDTFATLSSQETSRCNIFQEHYNLFFKYSLLEKTTLKEFLKERESTFAEFTKAELKQKNVEKCRSLYGYYNIKALDEVENVIRMDMDLMNKNFIKFSQENVQLTSELHLIWTKLIDNLSNI